LQVFAPLLFGRFSEYADRVLDRALPLGDRKQALDSLEHALRHLSPQGRPPEITAEDVARDLPAILQMYLDFVALMSDVDVPSSDSAQDAVVMIQRARAGDSEALASVEAHDPRFLQNPLALRPEEFDGMMAQLAAIKRPSLVRTFVSAVLIAKYGGCTGARASVSRPRSS
jgi:hypothetical protein